MRYFFSLFITTVLFPGIFVSSAQKDIAPPETIKSIQIGSLNENNLLVPFVPLHGILYLSFDDLEADEKDYYYKIDHLDKDWNLSELNTTEYITGYEQERITEYENSFNTLQDYTHYRLSIPNEYTRIKISGNYRISILNDDDEIVFTRHFVVYEPLLTVGVSLHRSRDVSKLETHQSVHFVIDHKNFRIDNPGAEIHPVIIRNNNFRTAITGLSPQFIRQGQLIYKYDRETAFAGGNEFWNFDTKDIYNTNMSVARIIQGNDLYHAYLFTDRDRSNDAYTYYPDINGNFVIRTVNDDNSRTGADYLWVHFSLEVPENFDREVYIYGAFNDYQLNNTNRMHKNAENGLYEAAILLKQGFYNYTYVIPDDGKVDDTALNGSHEETENEYTVLVYYTKAGSYYDRVIGIGKGSSSNLH